MKKLTLTLTIVVVFSIAISSCNNAPASASGMPNTQNYEQNKMSLEDQEKSDPLKFLSTKGTYRSKLIGKKFVIEGTIKNDATLATYKDVTIEFTFKSQTESVIGTDKLTFYEYFSPRSTKSFSQKINAPEGTSTIGWEIVDAKNL